MTSELDEMKTSHMPQPFAGLNPSGQVKCSRCQRQIAYDPRTSRWFDHTGVPGCAADEEGNLIEHDSEWNEEDIA